jgi:hypothetical protein
LSVQWPHDIPDIHNDKEGHLTKITKIGMTQQNLRHGSFQIDGHSTESVHIEHKDQPFCDGLRFIKKNYQIFGQISKVAP